MTSDSLLPVYSSSKGATAAVVALLVQRGQLDLDATVSSYWPEFAQGGKGAVTVRQLLSHQAGLPGVDGGFTWEELLAHAPLAERLAAQRPFWQPGQAFLYHGLTIGTLADELVRRIDGRTVADALREDVTGPARHRCLDGNAVRRRTTGSSKRSRRPRTSCHRSSPSHPARSTAGTTSRRCRCRRATRWSCSVG